MKKILSLASFAKLFILRPGNVLQKNNDGDVLCFPFYRHWIRVKITLAMLYLVTLTATFAQDAKSYYEKGLVSAREGKYEEAIQFFDQTIALNAGHYMARLDRGRTNLTLGLFKEAVADLDKAIKLYPRYYEGWFLRGLAKFNLEDYNGAIADYTQSISIRPNSTWCYYNRGLANEALGKMDAACTDYKKALQLGLSIARQKVDICNGTSTNPITTVTILQRAESYYDKGYESELSGKFEESIKFFDSAINLTADYFMAWLSRGYCKSMLGLFKEAITDFDQAIKLSPRYTNAWLERGVAKHHTGDFEGALTDYNHTIALDSNNATSYYNRGLVYIALNKKDSACTDFNNALRLGFAEARQAMDVCNNKQITGDNNGFIILNTDGANEKLMVSAPQITTKDENTVYIIPFFINTIIII